MSNDTEIFGNLVLGTQVEEAYQEVLEKWLPTYLGYVDRLLGKGEQAWLPMPLSYTITSDWDHFPEEQVPAILIMARGIEDVAMDGERNYRGKFHMRVGAFVQTSDRKTTEQIAKYYAAGLRIAIMQHGNLEEKVGKLVATKWRGEDYGVHIGDRTQRTFGSCEVKFSTEARGIVRRGGGLLIPNPTPQKEPPPWPTVREEPTPPDLQPVPITQNVPEEVVELPKLFLPMESSSGLINENKMEARLEGDIVRFRGTFKSGGALIANTRVFTLPISLRPSTTRHVAFWEVEETTDISVEIKPNGEVIIRHGVGGPEYLSSDGITFTL